MTALETATVGAEGIADDRYARGEGTFTNPSSNGHAVTLIAAEALEDTRLPDGTLSSAVEMRRNLVTRGVELNALVGRRFRVGEVELVGRRPCEPCAHLQRLTRHGILRAFIHRGGLRADVVTPGTIAVGDPVVTADQPSG
ncbi:MOSC domain-containing protein [Thermoleophilia bacterium SCSIO 60948]|nr:MOSC domain-containing protein [Thermoleophilia bacterium SCSIO 60948]